MNIIICDKSRLSRLQGRRAPAGPDEKKVATLKRRAVESLFEKSDHVDVRRKVIDVFNIPSEGRRKSIKVIQMHTGDVLV